MGYGTAGGDTTVEINSTKKDKAGYEVEKGNIASFFHVKPVTLTTSLDILKKQETVLKTQILTEKAAALLAITGVAVPAAGFGFINAAIANETEMITAVKLAKSTVNPAGISLLTNLNAAANAGGANAYLLNFVKYANAYYLEKSIRNDIFVNEDKYFVLALKGITAKILTVVGSANLLKQPNNVTNMIINPIRTIIGGKIPEVNDEAVELYIRLPLLVEFYKNIFENGNDNYKKNKFENDETETIAFIPEVGSKWSGLIQCIFDESKYINNGIYGIENMNRIIIEVNNIFKYYKDTEKAKLVRTVVLDLVAEINRRYGVLRRKDINEFYQIKKKYTKNINDVGLINDVNFDILDDTNEYEDAGPSSQFTENIFNKNLAASKTLTNDINIVKDFRDKIHNELFSKKTELEELSKKSFVEKIKFYKSEIASTKNNETKVELIVKAIDESSNINSHNTDINIMFHELIMYPLKNLQVMNKWIYTFMLEYVPRMYFTYHNIQLNNSGNVDYFNAALAAPADKNALKTGMETDIKNPNKITKMIYDYLNVPANDVAGTIAYARDLNTLINNFVVHSSTNNILSVDNATYVAAVNGVAIPVNVNVVGNAIRNKILDYANGKIFNVATRFQNRSKIRQIISSYINENGGLTESINLIDELYAKSIVEVPAAVNANNLYKKLAYDLRTKLNDFVRLSPNNGPIENDLLNKVKLVNLLQEFTSDSDLIELKFVSVYKFIINYTKLQEVVEKSIENVKYMISKFRNNFEKTIITNYEKILLEIEDKLLLKVLTNQDTTDDAIFSVCNFELLNNSFGEIINGTRQINLSTDLYQSIMFDNTDANTNDLATLNSNILFKDIFKVYNGQTRSCSAHSVTDGGNFNIKECIYIRGNISDKRLLSKFNYLVYNYLDVFYDGSTKKIYNGLFNEFANKSQNSVIFGNNGINDIFTIAAPGALAAPGVLAVPAMVNANIVNLTVGSAFDTNDHILAQSLGVMIKTLITRVVNVQMPTKYHLLMTLAEVSPNMVEKYKTFLPIFISMFESLIKKCIIYKKLLDTTDPSVINGTTAVVNLGTDVNILSDLVGENQTLTGRWEQGDSNNNTHFNNVLTNLIEASRAIVNDANNVLNEISVKPQFFELKENFIKNFYNNTNKLPLMPISTLSATLNNNIPLGQSIFGRLFPSKTIVEHDNKFLYGSNCILNSKNLDNDINNYLWLKDAIKSYNNSVVSVNKIDIAVNAECVCLFFI